MSAVSQSAPLPTIGGVAISRPLALFAGLAAALLFIGLVSLALSLVGVDVTPKDPDAKPTALARAAVALFDYRPNLVPPFPFTIQNATWIVFFIGLADLAWITSRAIAERRQLSRQVLPEDEDVMFGADALEGIARRIPRADRGYLLQQVILRATWQFLSTGSISQSTEVMNVSLELCDRGVDQNYTLSRYIIWLIPTIGFIGTVLGISVALGSLDTSGGPEAMGDSLAPALDAIGLAFNTTLVSLLLSAILVLLAQLAEAFEEETTKRIGQYCIDHLINKIYDDEKE